MRMLSREKRGSREGIEGGKGGEWGEGRERDLLVLLYNEVRGEILDSIFRFGFEVDDVELLALAMALLENYFGFGFDLT